MLANKMTGIVDLYHREMKMIKEEQNALDNCEKRCFQRFLERCADEHSQSWKSVLGQLFKEETWQEQKNEEPSPTQEKTILSMQSCVTENPDPVAMHKYSAD